MTVEQLIEELKKFPPHMIVIVTKPLGFHEGRIADGVEYVGESIVLITSHQ